MSWQNELRAEHGSSLLIITHLHSLPLHVSAWQNELRAEHGVEVDDKLKVWRVAYPFVDDDEEDE